VKTIRSVVWCGDAAVPDAFDGFGRGEEHPGIFITKGESCFWREQRDPFTLSLASQPIPPLAGTLIYCLIQALYGYRQFGQGRNFNYFRYKANLEMRLAVAKAAKGDEAALDKRQNPSCSSRGIKLENLGSPSCGAIMRHQAARYRRKTPA
jgi:hypothetical protein